MNPFLMNIFSTNYPATSTIIQPGTYSVYYIGLICNQSIINAFFQINPSGNGFIVVQSVLLLVNVCLPINILFYMAGK